VLFYNMPVETCTAFTKHSSIADLGNFSHDSVRSLSDRNAVDLAIVQYYSKRV